MGNDTGLDTRAIRAEWNEVHMVNGNNLAVVAPTLEWLATRLEEALAEIDRLRAQLAERGDLARVSGRNGST